MSGNRTGKGIKRRRVDDSISKSFAHKHKNSSKFKDVQERRIFTERYFWTLSCCIIVVWILMRIFDFSLVPLSYRGLYINRPFDGLHAWHFTSQAWAARSHVNYGLGYTKGYRTLVVGDPPPEQPLRYVSHPPLETIISASGILIFGTEEWAIRLFELILSIPALLLIMYILSKLYSCSVALLCGLLLVIITIFAYFSFDFMLVLMALWALYRYLILIGRLKDGPQPKTRHLIELAAALFLVIQFGWAGVFYAFAIGLHFVLRSFFRWQVSWPVLAVIIVAPLLSTAFNFYVMINGFKSNIKAEAVVASANTQSMEEQPKTAWTLLKTLYKWRSREGERANFIWKDWFATNGIFALTNFTIPVLILLGAYLSYFAVSVFIYLNSLISRGWHDYSAYIPRFFNHIWFFILPGSLFIFTFKGLFWVHQYWQSPLTLFVVVGAVLSLFLIGDFFGKASRWLGRFMMVVLFFPVVCYCNMGLVNYRDQIWHSPRTINLFKELNQKIPPNQALLTFKDYIVDQSEGKAKSLRPEYAWYLDRDMVVADAWLQDPSLLWKVQIVDIVSATVREIRKQARTGRFQYYYIPERDSLVPDPNALDRKVDWKELAKIRIIDMDKKLNDYNFGDDEKLTLEKHRRYQELLIRKLKSLYNYEYYENTAKYGEKDYSYSGDTPGYIFDLTRPK